MTLRLRLTRTAVEEIDGGRRVDIDGTDDASAASALRTLLELPAVSSSSQCVLLVERPWMETRRLIGLPRVRESSALRVIALDADRQFRSRGHLSLTGHWSVDRSAPRVFEVAAIRDVLLHRLEETARTAGVRTITISPSAVRRACVWISQDRRQRATRRWSSAGRIGWVVAIISIGLAATVTESRLERSHRAWTSRVEAIADHARAAAAEQRDAARWKAEIAALRGDVVADRVAGKLGRLLAALPDSSYVDRVQISDSGFAEFAGGALRTTAVAAGLSRAELPVQTVRDEGLGADRRHRGWSLFSARSAGPSW